MEILINFLIIGGSVIDAIIIWLLSKTNKLTLPQKILFVFFSGIFFLLFNFYAELNNIADSVTLLIGPLLYVYAITLFIEGKKPNKNNNSSFKRTFLKIENNLFVVKF